MIYLVILLGFLSCFNGEDLIDVNDILNADFMPGSLLMIDNSTAQEFETEELSNNASLIETSGSYEEALTTMGYHRTMMNEYLCRNFLADEILEEMSPVRFERRIGSPSSNISKKSKSHSKMADVKQNMLFDSGSSNYRDWLKKTTTLEDIYRHYGMQRRIGGESDDDEEQDSEDFEGEVTGYAVEQGPLQPRPIQIPYHPQSVRFPVQPVPNIRLVPRPVPVGPSPAKVDYGHSGYGYSSGETKSAAVQHSAPSAHGGYGFQPQHVYYHHDVGGGGEGGYGSSHGSGHESGHGSDHGSGGHGGSGKKDMVLKDLFDIALTALAFLAFGVFAIQVLVCISAALSTTTTATTATGLGIKEGESDVRRMRRDIVSNTVINELARRVLLSMEAVFVAEQDEGNCLRHHICQNNKYSRTLGDNYKIWVPVYGFGLSWLSGRVSKSMAPAPAMLESLKAAALGLGYANCTAIYPNCDLKRERVERRRRRRRKR